MLLLMTAALTGEGFERIGEHSGVVVYRRPGHAIDLAAEGDIDAPPAVVEKILLDYRSHPKWVHGLKVSRVLDEHDHALDVYQRLDLPMLDDRDFVLHVTWSAVDGKRVLQFHTANDRAPPQPSGVVRVPLNQGSWQLLPLEGGARTHAVYKLRMELGGKLPMWMARGRAAKDVPALFDGIRKQIRYYQ
jgi:hypothetical protein